MVNLSRYSARPGTEAAKCKQIDEAEVKRRSKTIFDLINMVSLENNHRWIGWRGEVLFNEKTDGGIKGRNFAYKPVFVKDRVGVGQTHTIQIDQVTANSLLGRIVS